MQTTVKLLGKQILIDISESASKELSRLSVPLRVEMELYFSCLIRKAVRFNMPAEPRHCVEVMPGLKVGFRPVATRACSVSETDGAPPVEDFPTVKPEAFVPKKLEIDFRNGQWAGRFSMS